MALRLVAAFTVAVVCLLAFSPGHSGVAHATTPAASATCPSETTSCVNVTLPSQICATAPCSVSVGPVTNLGQGQAVYLDVNGLPLGDTVGEDVGLAYCSLAQGDQVQADPACATIIPAPAKCPVQPCSATPSPLQWQYGQTISSDTVLSIDTEYDPDIPGASGIVSQTRAQAKTNTHGSFFCDNTTHPCGIEVTEIPLGDVTADGNPPNPYSSFTMTSENTVVIPITFNPGGNGCGSAPVMPVDAAYSAAQFLPAAAAATCTGPGGVGVIATDLQSVDASGCSTGAGSACPITDVIDGSVPATFTDDPEDPATMQELQAAGGKFAYIPISVSSTEIAFVGAAGLPVNGGTGYALPLHSYQLTPAQVAGVLTGIWNYPVASSGSPEDDLCGQMSSTDDAKCIEDMQTSQETLHVETVNGKYQNTDVANASGEKSKYLPFSVFQYEAPDNYGTGPGGVAGQPGTATDYPADTGFALLNPWPLYDDGGSTPVEESWLGAMFPSTASGSVFQLTGWLCGAPQVPYPVTLPFPGQTKTTFNDITSSQQLLSNAENGPIVVQKPPQTIVDEHTTQKPTKCQTLSTLPIDFVIANQGAEQRYQPSSSPLTAAHTLDSAIPSFAGSGGLDFTAMDSSEADFFGLFPASLQNAAGSFQLPSASSVLAALSHETTNADGTLSPSFDNTGDSSAYPLPMVTYALVSTAPQPSMAQATYLKDMLTNLVNYSYTAGVGTTNPLPSGYVPLPNSLYQQALGDIAKDVVGPGGVSPPPPGSSTGTGSQGGSGAAGGAGVASTGNGTAFRFNTGAAHSGSEPAASGSSGTTSGGTGDYLGHLITVTLGDSRFFIPGLLLLALLCLIGGPLLYLSPSIRKTHAVAEGEGDDVDPPPPEPGPEG